MRLIRNNPCVILTILLFMIFSTVVIAQECKHYKRLIEEGDTFLMERDFQAALKKYNSAQLNCQEKLAEVQEKILILFKEIEELKKVAVEQKQAALLEKEKAEKALIQVEKQKQEAEKERKKAETALLKVQKQKNTIKFEQERNQRIINSLYFYRDSFALASKRITTSTDTLIKYGFIDKFGNTTIKYKYDEASSFDKTEFAKVKRDGYDYLIDTKGNEYRTANNIGQLNKDIIALDLRNEDISELPKNVYNNVQLEILILPEKSVTKVTSKIEKLINLKEVIGTIANFSAFKSSRVIRAKILQVPVDYIKPTQNISIGIRDKLTPAAGKNDWVVSSDRDNNLVYDAPSNRKPNGKIMNFMDNFYVIGETNTHLQLIKYDPVVASNSSSRKVNMKKAKYYGWAPKNKLLLWRNSLVNSNTNFNIKGLVVHSAKRYSRGIGGEQQLTLYNSPTLEKTAQNENDIRLFEFLYIYDKKDNSYLVGVSPRLMRSNVASQKTIKGWISGDNIQLWKGRLCLEPNSDTEAVAERRAKGIKSTLFNSYDAALELKMGKPPRFNKILWDDDQYEKGYPPSQKRMPVFNKMENNIYKTAVITEVFQKGNQRTYSAADHAKLDVEYNAVRDKKQNINLIFVIDGTESNHPFFVPIINAIKNSLNLFENPNKKYEIATFIYGKSGEGVISRQPLTSNHAAITRTLENYRSKINLLQDNDEPTDMYEAIGVALHTLDPKETNIIVLIGDAGNAPNVSNLKLIQKIKEKECGIIAFQTRSVSGRRGLIYHKFIDQSKELVVESSKRTNLLPSLYESEGNTYRLRYPEEAALPGSLTFSDKGASMSQAELEEEIRQMLKSFEKKHNALLHDLDCKIYVDCKPGINDAVLENILKDVPDIDLRTIRDLDYQFFAEGYAPMHLDNLEYPLFKYVLFLTDRELYQLETTLKRLIIGGAPTELRENVVKVYKETLMLYYGGEVGNVSDKTLAQLMESVTGLPSKSDLLDKYTLKDLEDRRKVSDDEILDIVDYIEDKLLAMKKVIGNPKYYFRSRDNTYYWVPQEVIP